ncbi:hypothetical protein NIES2135_21260 [Leptolyngbya boryana NIES-2135]|uniref:Uncharacterized protein n=1 Tax=Leptolyngbya boryana NIES-2135 TaxID=1973484 RepID=A0A1Z4JF72_LEPBY|nr:hypothetical protein NIES2135_21260 [Leptolyngbya boryana NIES-2135]
MSFPVTMILLGFSVLVLSIAALSLATNETIVDAIAYRIKWVRHD